MAVLRKGLLTLTFLALTPVSDAINGYMKAETGECWVAVVGTWGKVTLVCPWGIAVERVGGIQLRQEGNAGHKDRRRTL